MVLLCIYVLFFVLGFAQEIDYEIKYCQHGCTKYFDGCNDCYCQSDGTSICDKKLCETMTEDHCIQCNSNTQWNSCGSPCTKDCNNRIDFTCIEECQERCECSYDLPIWDTTTNKCIAESECEAPTIGDNKRTTLSANVESIPQENLIEIYCYSGCTSYYDGCNVCKCTTNTTSVCDTSNSCDVPDDHHCLACTSNQEWNECGSECMPTCEDPEPKCITECERRCFCPHNTVWNGVECVAYSNCKIKPANSNCHCETKTSHTSSYTRSSIYCQSQKEETDCNLRICTWKCD